MNPFKKINVGIVGAGSMGREHARAFNAIDNVEVVAFCSRTRDKAESLARECLVPNVYTSPAEMFQNHSIDIAVVAVNISSMKDVCFQCFEYPALFLVEKPLGVDLDETLQIYNHAKEHRAQAYVAFNRRFYSSTRKIKADLMNLSGRCFIKVQDQEDLISAEKDGHPEKVLNNWMFANSIHLIDLLTFYAKAPIQRLHKVGSIPDKKLAFFPYHVFIEYENGDLGEYEGIWNGQGPWAVTITTAEKRFELKPLEHGSYQNFPDRTRHEYPLDELDKKFKPGFYLQALHAIKAVRKEDHELVSLDEGLRTTQLVHEMFHK